MNAVKQPAFLLQKKLPLKCVMEFLSALLLIFVATTNVFAQQEEISKGQESLALHEVIDMALERSIASLKAATVRENRYWQWRTYKSNYLPQLALEGVLPEFGRTINPVTQPDGSVLFQPVANSNSFLNLSLSQGISATGGEIFINTELQRFDDFDRDLTYYNGNPAIIGVRQPLFAYNELGWDKKIEPLRYEESQKTYTEEMEAIAYFTSLYFFDLLNAQIGLEIARKNLANNDTILKISQVKFQLGKISKGELLQLKLALKNSEKSLAQASLSYETALLQLNTYAGINLNEKAFIEIPAAVPNFPINEKIAIEEAWNNRQKAMSMRRTILEAERDVAKAKGDNGLNATLFATFGLTNRANTILDIYQNTNDQQSVRIGFTIPVVDWGRSASRIKTARANQELVQYTFTQDEINFDQEIRTQIRKFEMLRGQVKLTYDADQMAAERYFIFKNRFLIGELTFTDLNLAQQEKDQATRDYITTVRDFWLAFYNLRLLTLYDFEQEKTIEYVTEK